MEENIVIFEKNQKGNDTLLYDGHRFNKTNRINKNGSTFWRCVNKNECSGSVTVDVHLKQVLRKSEHKCLPHQEKNDVLIKMNKLKKEVCKNLTPVKGLFEKSFDTTSTPSTSLPTFHEKKDTLYRARKKFLNADKLTFNTVKDVSVPESLAQNFLVAEVGEEDKILLFASKLSRKIMQGSSSHNYYGDGTFKSVAKPFYQLYTLHIDLHSDENTTSLVPVVYALLPDKSQNTYTRLFRLIKELLGVTIKTFKSDYEIAAMNAVKAVFPQVKVSGCYFHYQKAVWKKAKELKVNRTSDQRNIIRRAAILPLLPPDYIAEGWQIICEKIEATRNMDNFLHYFEKQWNRLGPSLLSCAGQRHRTTNALEGWHHRLNVLIPTRPSLFNFIHKIRKESKHFDILMKRNLFTTRRKNRRNRDIQFDKQYNKLLAELTDKRISVQYFFQKIIYYQLLL
ncbi:hypothetical protein ABMA28_011331 [Loxostege sticticalis]|uniref:MULE transposase domain-containing protein n=1 Tax=Loxostege sticticalis TaxID=481309 RepID=A0ABD0S735_LOXSC